jgi:hypothetical protein
MEDKITDLITDKMIDKDIGEGNVIEITELNDDLVVKSIK